MKNSTQISNYIKEYTKTKERGGSGEVLLNKLDEIQLVILDYLIK
jgi:hypothetical protein